MILGDKLLNLRRIKKYSQEQLALKMDVSRQTISNWESNLSSPDLNQALKLCSLFNVDIKELVDENTEVSTKRRSTNKIISKLIGKESYIITSELVEEYNCLCTVLEIDNEWVKIEYKKGKRTVTSLINIDDIASFKIIEKKVGK